MVLSVLLHGVTATPAMARIDARRESEARRLAAEGASVGIVMARTSQSRPGVVTIR